MAKTRNPPRTPVSESPGSAVLCGTDFSPEARRAGEVAAALARRLQVRVDLVHVSVIPAFPPLREDLRTEAARLRRLGPPVDETLLTGTPDEALAQRSASGSCRLIVLSSLGKPSPERWIVGSVSERTAERARVPTLVVRDAAPIKAWARGTRTLKIFVAFNLTATSEAALRQVAELQAIGPCKVVVGYVDWPPEQGNRLGTDGPVSLIGNPPEVQAILQRDVRARAAEILKGIPFRLRIEGHWGRPDTRLAEMAREEKADLILVGSHQYSGFERLWHRSVSRGLLHIATESVMVVPMASGLTRQACLTPPIRRILVATDFSEPANRTIPIAYSLLGGGGTVHLVHVAHPRDTIRGKNPPGPPVRGRKARHARHLQLCVEQLRALIPAGAQNQGIFTEEEVLEDTDPAKAIRQAAERFAADVICLGTRGKLDPSHALMGSVMRKVLADSERPLLVVRPPSDA